MLLFQIAVHNNGRDNNKLTLGINTVRICTVLVSMVYIIYDCITLINDDCVDIVSIYSVVTLTISTLLYMNIYIYCYYRLKRL